MSAPLLDANISDVTVSFHCFHNRGVLTFEGGTGACSPGDGTTTSPALRPALWTYHMSPSTVGRNSKVSMLASMHQSAVTIVGIVLRLWYILAKIYFPVGLGIQLDTFLYFTIILTLKYNTEMHLVAPMNKFNIPLQTQLVISRVDEGDERGDPRTEKGLPTGFVRVKGFEEKIM